MKTARIDEIHSLQFGTENERLEWLKPRVQKELSDLHREIHDKGETRRCREGRQGGRSRYNISRTRTGPRPPLGPNIAAP